MELVLKKFKVPDNCSMLISTFLHSMYQIDINEELYDDTMKLKNFRRLFFKV